MRVLLISHTAQSREEGQPRARELAKFGDVELYLLVPQRFNHFGPWREAEIPLDLEYSFRSEPIRWPWLGPAQNYLHWYPSLPKIICEFQPDVIDLWEETWSLCSAHACYLRNRLAPQARIVAETEQNILKQLPPPFEALRSYVLRNADYGIGRSEEAVGVLRAKGFQGPAQSIPNAVDAELFRPLDRAACRAELKFEGFVAGYVGRLVEEKGVFDFLQALSLCPPDIHGVFVGDGPCREALQQQTQQLGLSERVEFLPQRPLRELPRVMNALDVLVLPSRTTSTWKEQFGRVLIEAHACATPVVGSDSGAIPDVIGEGGAVVPEANARALTDALIVLNQNPETTRKLGEIGRRQVEEKYTWTQVAARLHAVYSEILKS